MYAIFNSQDNEVCDGMKDLRGGKFDTYRGDVREMDDEKILTFI